MKFVRLLLALCALCVLAGAQESSGTYVRFGPSLPTAASYQNVFILTGAVYPGIYICNNAPTCTSTSQWLYTPVSYPTGAFELFGEFGTITTPPTGMDAFGFGSNNHLQFALNGSTTWSEFAAAQACPNGVLISSDELGSTVNCDTSPTVTGPVTANSFCIGVTTPSCISAWPSGTVTSVFGRTGVVTATTGDYNFSQISGTLSVTQMPFQSLQTTGTTGPATLNPTTGVLNIPQYGGSSATNGLPVGTDTGAANAYVVANLVPAMTSYTQGSIGCFIAANASTSTTPTVEFNSITPAQTIVRQGTALANGDIVTTDQTCVIYDGTHFELMAPAGHTGSGLATYATSPTLGGTPLAPTAAAGTNTTQIATTAFVMTAVGDLIGTESDVIGQSTSQTAVTLATPTTAGEYTVRIDADLHTPCTTGSNSVIFTANWTTANGARLATTATLTMGSSQTTGSYVQAFIPINSAVSDPITYSSTVTGTCTTGTSSYDVHASVRTP